MLKFSAECRQSVPSRKPEMQRSVYLMQCPPGRRKENHTEDAINVLHLFLRQSVLIRQLRPSFLHVVSFRPLSGGEFPARDALWSITSRHEGRLDRFAVFVLLRTSPVNAIPAKQQDHQLSITPIAHHRTTHHPAIRGQHFSHAKALESHVLYL